MGEKLMASGRHPRKDARKPTVARLRRGYYDDLAQPRTSSQYGWKDAPRYNGPHWIGKPITAPPTAAGPDWIGKALPYRRNYTLPPSDNIGA
jgi:hypothetical protein